MDHIYTTTWLFLCEQSHVSFLLGYYQRFQHCGLRNSECHTRTPRGVVAKRRRSMDVEENGAGPSAMHGGGEGQCGIFNHGGRGQARCAFRAWGSGGAGISHVYAAGRLSERTAYPSTW